MSMMTAETAGTVTADATARPASPRVLVFRSCRMPQFTATLAWVRAHWPSASIDVVTSPGFDAPLRQAGVARTFIYDGRAFGLLRHARLVRRLRAERFDHLVIPQANHVAEHHANLYRAARAIGAGRFVVAAPDTAPVVHDPAAFGHLALFASIGRLLDAIDVPVLLAQLLAGWVWPRAALAAGRPRRRVLHVISSLGVGGAQVQLAELLSRTDPARFDVDVFVLGRQDGDFSRQWLTRDDITFHYATGWPRRSQVVVELARLCRRERYDLVHTWLFMANVVGAAGARLGGVPRLVGSVRNLSLWKRTWYAQWWFRAADALATRLADVVTVNATPLVADHAAWTWLSPGRLRVVHNGLEPSRVVLQAADARQWLRETLHLAPETPVVGTVGRLAPEKDQAMFVAAVAEACAARPDLHAVIVGDGVLRETLEADVRARGLAGRVHLLGERRDSRRLIAGLDLFVLTSHIEGFANVLLEAAFLGVPAIATRVGGAVDLLHDGDLMDCGDASGAARLMLDRLDRPDEARRLAEATRARAFDRFTASHSAAQWFALYDQLLSDKGEGQ